MQPFGGPVVPDVYTRVSRSSSRIAARALATAPGSRRRWWRPRSPSWARSASESSIVRMRSRCPRTGEAGDPLPLGGVLAHEHPRRGMGEHVCAVGRCRRRVDRDDDGADRDEREVGERPLEPGPAEDRHAVARPDAERQEPRGELLDPPPRLLPADGSPAPGLLDHEGGVPGRLGHGARDQSAETLRPLRFMPHGPPFRTRPSAWRFPNRPHPRRVARSAHPGPGRPAVRGTPRSQETEGALAPRGAGAGYSGRRKGDDRC